MRPLFSYFIKSGSFSRHLSIGKKFDFEPLKLFMPDAKM